MLKMNRQKKAAAEVGRNRRICRFMRVTAALGVLASISVLLKAGHKCVLSLQAGSIKELTHSVTATQNMTGGS